MFGHTTRRRPAVCALQRGHGPYGNRYGHRLMALCLSGALLAACGDDKLPQPEPLSSATVEADLSGIEDAPRAAKAALPTARSEYRNFANAWLRVKVLQLYAAGLIALPAAAVAATLNQQPTLTGGKWIWELTALGSTASLQIQRTDVGQWKAEMLVSNSSVTDFLWLEGQYDATQSEGSWTIHDPELSGSTAVLGIDWSYASETEHTLTYRNIDQSSADVGDKIEYQRDGNDASVVFTDASDSDSVARIAWDATTGVGSIEVPNYNDGNKACWGTDFKDTDCS